MNIKSLFLINVILFLSLITYSQTLVSTDPELKTVVLEEFTGINCPNCPDGHAIAENIRAANPDRVIIVGIHQGSYAQPSAGQPDFRTSFGDALANQSALTGYPAGTVNRHLFPNYAMNNGTAMSRSAWTYAANQILLQQSPVNVGVKSTFEPSSRLLTVEVEVYYTSTPPASNNYINVALLESNVIAYQAGASSNYNHKNILRHFLTGQWGDTIQNLSSGSFRAKTYTYTVPSTYNINNCDVAVYVAETHQEIYSGKRVTANGGSSQQIGYFSPGDYIEIAYPSTNTNIPLVFTSKLQGTETFNISLTSDAPNDWSASFTIDGNTYTGTGSVNFIYNIPENISIDIIPGNTSDIATYTLTATSVSQPSLSPVIKKIILISNVTDIIVNNVALWGDGGSTTPATFQSNFIKGLQKAGETKYDVIPLNTFIRIGNAGKLNNIIAVYYNVGWSFPSFTDESVAIFSNYLDNGGNMLVSGQDIGWDNFDVANGGSGTALTQSFYTDYLHSTFVNDGTSSNNILSINTTDAVFGNCPNSSIINAYGSGSSGAYMYPDQINPTSSGNAIFWYNGNTSKIGGVRSNVIPYKTVNMGISLEMIGDTNVRKQFISIAHDWFHGIIISNEEFDMQVQNAVVKCYPNPATDYVFIQTYNNIYDNIECELLDIYGRIIKKYDVLQNDNTFKINVNNIEAGIYYIKIINKNNLNISCPLSIIK